MSRAFAHRTYFHIGKSWGLDESNVYRTIKKIENILIREKDFSLPGQRELFKENNNLNTVVIDVTESPIERPKKNKNNFTVARKRSIH